MNTVLANNPRWRRRVLTCVALTAGAFLLVGAGQVTRELRSRPAKVQQVSRCWQQWACMLVNDVPGGYATDWQQVARTQPQLILQACAAPEPQPQATLAAR